MSLIRLSLSTLQIQLSSIKITHETQLMLLYGGVCMLMMNIAACFLRAFHPGLHGSVTGILVLEISIRRTKIFAGKYGPPL